MLQFPGGITNGALWYDVAGGMQGGNSIPLWGGIGATFWDATH